MLALSASAHFAIHNALILQAATRTEESARSVKQIATASMTQSATVAVLMTHKGVLLN